MASSEADSGEVMISFDCFPRAFDSERTENNRSGLFRTAFFMRDIVFSVFFLETVSF